MNQRTQVLLAGAVGLALLLVVMLVLAGPGREDRVGTVMPTASATSPAPATSPAGRAPTASPPAADPPSSPGPEATVTVTPAPSPAPDRPAGTPTATGTLPAAEPAPEGLSLVLLPGGIAGAPPQVQLPAGATLPVEMRLQNPGGQQVDGVEVHLEFDPNLFEVVDDAGAPVRSVTPGSLFPLVLQNQVDQSAGRIDVAFGRDFTQAPPSGGGLVARFVLRPRGQEGSGRLRLSDARPSQAAFSGRAFPLQTVPGGLTISVVR